MSPFDKLYKIATDLIAATHLFEPKSYGYLKDNLPKLSEGEVYKAKVSFHPSDCKSTFIDGLSKAQQERISSVIHKNITNQEFITQNSDMDLSDFLKKASINNLINLLDSATLELPIEAQTLILETMKEVEKFANIRFVNNGEHDNLISICSNTLIFSELNFKSYTKRSVAPDNGNILAWIDTNVIEQFPEADSQNYLLYSVVRALGLYLPPSAKLQHQSALNSLDPHKTKQLCASLTQTKLDEASDICKAAAFFTDTISSSGIKLTSLNDRFFTQAGELAPDGSVRNTSLTEICFKEVDSYREAKKHCMSPKLSTWDMNGLRSLYGNGPENYEGAINVPSSEAKLIGYVTADDF